MIRRIWTTFVVTSLTITGVARASNEDLKQELSRKQKALAELSSQIDQAIGPEFHSDRDIQLKLATNVIERWARKISAPDYTITAQGTSIRGNIDDGNGYKVWIDDPTETKAAVRFSPFALTFGSQQAVLKTNLAAHAETRIWGKALVINTNVFCQSSPDVTTPAEAVATLTNAKMGDVTYVVNLVRPANLTATVACGLGALGNYTLSFPMNQLAQEISKGEFTLGYQDKLEITIPTNPQKNVVFDINARDQKLIIGSDMIEAGANLDVRRRQ